MTYVRRVGVALGFGIGGSFLAVGISVFVNFANQFTLGSPDNPSGGFWMLVGSFFGMSEEGAIRAGAILVYFVVAGAMAGLGVVEAWPYAKPEPRDWVGFGPSMAGGVLGAFVCILALPILAILLADFADIDAAVWGAVAVWLVLSGVGAVAAATVGRVISELIVRAGYGGTPRTGAGVA